jgi:hypothetical protein
MIPRERFGHDAVRANFDLADFFENLPGNHGAEYSSILRSFWFVRRSLGDFIDPRINACPFEIHCMFWEIQGDEVACEEVKTDAIGAHLFDAQRDL